MDDEIEEVPRTPPRKTLTEALAKKMVGRCLRGECVL